ncbi:hypothetical protein [Pseudobacter ginsenosidimutans]|uniref:Uncharacterized protein n=1 Tax=Pseudobacter ginsenosidimutans TaxID=661488 RepID=A0A4Q7N3C4_9BACT|nr:hypothetical protein [Pseudobacter ginsenosidimutans]QEC43769.1 hypothetical protein FSB84_19560 [Pseudobacter ginsenosidimutans]RZS75185.1 hypothetical protein EV199_1047 [Pseudobacter ginsenosidimutans]
MARYSNSKKVPTPSPKRSYLWVAGLAIFGLIPLLKKCISSYRYNTEIRPIVDGLIENNKRMDAVVYGDTGRIYTLASNSSPEPSYRWYNGYQSMPNDSLYFNIRLETREGYARFSRDSSVGQVVCVLIDTKNDSSDNQKVFGIYFQPGKDIPVHNDMNLRRAVIYAADPGYIAYFVADTFEKDSSSAQGVLARQRLKKIKEELEKRKMDSFSIKTF